MERISVENFRRFTALAVDLEPDVTVLVGSNAGGKTALLDAIAVILGAYVAAFDTGRGTGFRATDAHVRPVGHARTPEAMYPVAVSARMSAYGREIPLRRELRGSANRTTTADAAALRDLGKALQAGVRAGEDETLPVVAYYGTGRMWRRLPGGRRLNRSRLGGYADCLQSATTYRDMVAWMRWATLADLQGRSRSEEAGPLARAVLHNLAETGSMMLHVDSDEPELVVRCQNLRFDFETEEIVADLALGGEPVVTLPVSSLSDGIRGVLGLVTDLALRMAVLNPHLGATAHRDTPGVVLIDEIDLHLHPSWQQQVLVQLQQAFPAVQLIVTTHSPQVLTTVRGECIRRLDGPDVIDGQVPRGQFAYTLGHESGELLRRVQRVHERPPTVETTRELRRYFELIDAGLADSPEATQLREGLDAGLGGPERETALLRADNAIRIARHRRR